MPFDPGTRIAIVGPSGCGKTTLARAVARRLGLCHVELDTLFWEPNWTPSADEVLRRRVEAALGSDGWVSDGNYSKVADLTLDRAHTVVRIDYSFGVVAWRLLRRTFRRGLRRELLWNGNRESFHKALFTRDSILLWLLKSYRPVRRRYRELLTAGPAHARVVHLRSPAVTQAWLASLPVRPAAPDARPESDRVPAEGTTVN